MSEVDGLSIREDESLVPHTASRVGGTCDRWIVVHTWEAMLPALAHLKEDGLKLSFVGQGTRLVPRDGGLSGGVIRLGAAFQQVRIDDTTVTVGAATPMAVLVDAVTRAGLSGLEDFASHPGSIGASVALDPGPKGGWEAMVTHARWIARGGIREGDLATARKLKRPLYCELTLSLSPMAAGPLQKAVDKAWKKRRPSTWWKPFARGSMVNAITRTGLRGVRVRTLVIPEAAPDMVVNLGGATAKELAFFERMVVDRVRKERGVDLETRMVWAGSHGGKG